MDTLARHLIMEYRGCRRSILDDLTAIEAILTRAAEAARATVVASRFHRFSPHGVSGVVIIEESHLAIHTWPESGYAAVDFYTCGPCEPEEAHRVLARELGATSTQTLLLHRGLEPPGPSLAFDAVGVVPIVPIGRRHADRRRG